MYRGYVKLWRKLEDSDIFKNEKALKIWIWILIRANHKENTVLFGRQKINLKPGEFIMGLNRASEHLGLAKSTIHFWINYLNQSGMIELKKTNKFSLIKINNWIEYQDTETQMELKKNSKKTLKETDKNDKDMIKNEKEDTSPNGDLDLKIPFELNQVWLDFLEMRKKIKSPMTERAKQLMVKKIETYDLATAKAMLEQSIMNSWKDIYPLKETPKLIDPIEQEAKELFNKMGEQAVFPFGKKYGDDALYKYKHCFPGAF